MSIEQHARRELDILVKTAEKDNRPIIEEFIPEIIQLCKKFGESGQSGGPAPYVAAAITQTIKKLMLYLPVCPITGIDEEWNLLDYNDCTKYQNNRCSAIFKNDDNKAYYLDAIIWQGEDEWDAFTGWIDDISSKQFIDFPFEPKTFYIDVFKEYNTKEYFEKNNISYFDDFNNLSDKCADKKYYTYKIKDKSQLKQVAEYYDVDQNFIDFISQKD